MVLHLAVIAIAFDVFAAGVDVAEDAFAVDEQCNAGESGVVIVQVPAVQGAPIGVDGDGEFESELFGSAFNLLQVQGIVGFVVICANDLKAALGVVAMEFIEGGGGVDAIAAAGSGPPPGEDNFAAEVGKFQGCAVDPILEFPFGTAFADFGGVCSQTRENR